MALNLESRRLLARKALALLGVLALLYFGIHLMQGDQSLLNHVALKHSIHNLEKEEAVQKAQLEEIEDKVKRLRPQTLDLDYAEEEARTQAGLTREGEQIILMNEGRSP